MISVRKGDNGDVQVVRSVGTYRFYRTAAIIWPEQDMRELKEALSEYFITLDSIEQD